MANKLLFSGSKIEIQCDRGDEQTYELLTHLYPVHQFSHIRTRFFASLRKTPEVLQLFRGVTAENILEAPEAIQGHYFAEMMRRENTERLLEHGPQELPVVTPWLTLDPHQQLGRELARFNPKYAFFYDTRTGKTPMSLAIILDDVRANPDAKWLILCPKKLVNLAWIPDIKKFGIDKELTYANCSDGSREERLHRIATSNANVYILNTESYLRYKDAFEPLGIKKVVIDESSDLKSHKSKISETIVDLGQQVDRLYLLSGVPAPNDESEYYMQLKALDFFWVPQSYTQYCNHFLEDTSRSHQYHKWRMRPDKEEDHRKFLKPYAVYIDQSVLDMPGREFKLIELTMPEELRGHYNRMKNELYIELTKAGEFGDDTLQITAPSIATKLNKLNQITSGFIIDTEAKQNNELFGTNDDEWHLLSPYRFDFLEEYLKRPFLADEQVIVWAYYRKEFEIMHARLGDSSALCYGGVSNKQQEAAISAFMRGDVQYLLANPASADKGLTLTNSHNAIYFSLSYSYELFKQSAERIYGARRSQPHFCNYGIFAANGTIDPLIYTDVLMRKGGNSRRVLDHLKPGAMQQW